MNLNPEFTEILDELEDNAIDFYLAAGLYYAGKISFSRARKLAKLSSEEFHQKLKENYYMVWSA